MMKPAQTFDLGRLDPVRGKTLLGRPKTVAYLLERSFGEEEFEGTLDHLPSARAKLGAELRDGHWDASAFTLLPLRELTQAVTERVRSSAHARDVSILPFVDGDCVRVQPHAFLEAVKELLDNAVRFTRPGHPVILDACATGRGDVLIKIQDCGDGMSRAALAALGHPPREAWRSGSGIGVALAWAVVEKHGGLLRFESARGVGTTAIIWLPDGGS